MKKLIIAAAVAITGIAAIRRFGPSLHRLAMAKCHDMFERMSRDLESKRTAGDRSDVVTSIACDPAGCARDPDDDVSTFAAAN